MVESDDDSFETSSQHMISEWPILTQFWLAQLMPNVLLFFLSCGSPWRVFRISFQGWCVSTWNEC